MKNFVVGFSLDFHLMVFNLYSIVFLGVFRALSNNIPKILREFYCGYIMKFLLTNCSLHTENIRTLVFRTDLIRSIRTLKLRSECFAVWTSQLVNKSIVYSTEYSVVYRANLVKKEKQPNKKTLPVCKIFVLLNQAFNTSPCNPFVFLSSKHSLVSVRFRHLKAELACY